MAQLGAPRAVVNLQGITRRLGQRLLRSLRLTPPGTIPDKEWNESARLYKDLCFGIMVEQRRRVELLRGVNGDDDSLTDEQVEEELKQIALKSVRDMSDEKRREFMVALRGETPIDVESK